jgi:hypothetical protein
MCVFKNHAFIYFLRPPLWSGTKTNVSYTHTYTGPNVVKTTSESLNSANSKNKKIDLECACSEDSNSLYENKLKAYRQSYSNKHGMLPLVLCFKGTVAWDFLASVFFTNQRLIGPWWKLRNSFIFFRKFAEIFVHEVWLSAYYLRKVKLLVTVTPCF